MAYVSTDTTRRVRAELKQAYPNLKFSVSKKDGTLRVRIMSGDIDFRDVWEDIPQSKQYWKRYGNPKPHFEGYVDINTYHPDSYNPKYTDLFNGIIDIMKGDEWFDKSEPQIDYFNTAYYMKLSVGKWNKDYQYTGVPRMSDLFGRMRAEDDNNFRVESHTDRMARLQKQIEDAKEEMEKVKYCNHQEWESINKNIGLIDENSFSLTIKCSNCGSHGVAEWEKPTFISWDRTYMTEGFRAESFDADFQKMINMDKRWVKCHPCNFTWHNSVRKECLLCGDEPVNNDAEELLNSEEEDMNLLNTYFEEEVYRLSPDIYAEVKDRIDYNSKQLGNNPSHQDRLKQFQSRVRRIDENIYQRAMETAQMRMAKEEDFEAEGEDITLKDSAKLGFGLGAGLLGFRVALFGVSALVGGFILNRNK